MADATRRPVQDLGLFRLPPGFRGRSGIVVLAWQIVQATLFGLSPQPFYGWRRFLLRFFGARIGSKVLVRPTARITYPWKVLIGDRSWIGDHVVLYSLGTIRIGADTVVSQKSYLCAGTHDYRQNDFPLFASAITIGDEVWLATDVFVAPGITIGQGAVVGARSSVFHNIGACEIAMGSPARVTGRRDA